MTFGDFRPICLCNFVNKLFSRILCDRLKALFPGLILEEQSAFLRGRDISDSILLAQELVQHLDKKVRGHNILFKLDMMKVRVSEKLSSYVNSARSPWLVFRSSFTSSSNVLSLA